MKLALSSACVVVVLALASAPAGAEPAVALSGNTLLRFDTATSATVTSHPITGLQGVESVIGIDVRPKTGELFAVTVPAGALANALVRTYKVAPDTGAATFVGSIPATTVPGAADVPSGVDFNPTVDRIRVVNVNDENFRINPNNGVLSGDDPALNPAGNQIIALAYDRNTPRENALTIPTTLYGISRATSSLVVQGGINGTAPGGANGGLIQTIGPLGVTLDAGQDGGLDISATGTASPTELGTAYAVLRVGGVSRVFTINLASGAATALGGLPGVVTDVAILPTPASTPAPTPTAAVTAPTQTVDFTAPTAAVTATRAISLAALLKSGLKVRVAPNEPARLELSLLGTATRANLRAAVNLTLVSRTLRIAAGARTVRLTPSRRLVGSPRTAFKIRVRIVASDAAGNRRTIDKTVTVKPRKARRH
jgi:Domain of unknown function (DUF4394)